MEQYQPFTGLVVAGKQLGRTLGFPTANLQTDGPLPALRGVYACEAEAGGARLCAMMNIGSHPTVPEGPPTVEVYLCNFSGDLYGQTLLVRPLRFLRPERRFDSVEALRAQLSQDAKTAQSLYPQLRKD